MKDEHTSTEPGYEVLPGENLCSVCKDVSFDTIKGKSNVAKTYYIGYLDRILNTTGCALCRLVIHSFRLTWTNLPLKALSSERTKASISFSGPRFGFGTREMALNCSVPLPDSDKAVRKPSIEGVKRRFGNIRIGEQFDDESSTQIVQMFEANLGFGNPLEVAYDSVKRAPGPQKLRLLDSSITQVEPDTLQDNVRLLARRIEPQCCLDSFWQSSLRSCMSDHGDACNGIWLSKRNVLGSPNVQNSSHWLSRAIDVQKLCVVDNPQQKDYVTLSYVWGAESFLRLTTMNRHVLSMPNSLRREDIPLPRVVADAMYVVSSLKIRYLWVDAMCIIQDDDNDKKEQIARMGEIYSNATLTIVAADGDRADLNLPCLHEGKREVRQKIETIDGLEFATVGDELIHCIHRFTWYTRGWTYQEMLLSQRLLVFTPDQVYFQCRSMLKCEDTVVDDTAVETNLSKGSLRYALPRLDMSGGFWLSYLNIVDVYHRRDLTVGDDVIDAVAGILNILGNQFGEYFICGMPEATLEAALMFNPTSKTRPREGTYRGAFPFPSWSWIGWEGGVLYDDILIQTNFRPGKIHSEIKNWSIRHPVGNFSTNEFELETEELFVDLNYVEDVPETSSRRFSGRRNGEDPVLPLTDICADWKPTSWRREHPVVAKERMAAKIDDPFSQTCPRVTAISVALLSFTTRMATLNIYNPDLSHPDAPGDNNQVAICRIGIKPLDEEACHIGSMLVDPDLGRMLRQRPVGVKGQFIILSSLLGWMSQFTGSEPLYDETRFRKWDTSGEYDKIGLYNVMWVEQTAPEQDPDLYRRLAVGQVHVDGWNLADSAQADINLM